MRPQRRDDRLALTAEEPLASAVVDVRQRSGWRHGVLGLIVIVIDGEEQHDSDRDDESDDETD